MRRAGTVRPTRRRRRRTCRSHVGRTARAVSSLVPPAGLEPTLLAPEASALSTELRGRATTALGRHLGILRDGGRDWQRPGRRAVAERTPRWGAGRNVTGRARRVRPLPCRGDRSGSGVVFLVVRVGGRGRQ